MMKNKQKKFIVKINAPLELSQKWMKSAKAQNISRNEYLLNLIEIGSKNTTPSLYQVEKEKEFQEFWSQYPLKKAKDNSKRSFFRLTKKDKLAIKEALPLHLEHWSGTNKQFIPYASTWLNNRRWEDELDTDDNNFVYKETNIVKVEAKPKSKPKQLTFLKKVLNTIKN
jgi:hypothetical protein